MVREYVDFYEKDRTFYPDIAAVEDLLRGELAEQEM